jgi:hypothetical protein
MRLEWYGLDSSGSGYGPVAGFCERGNGLPGSVKCWKILEYLGDCWLLKKVLSPWSSLIS